MRPYQCFFLAAELSDGFRRRVDIPVIRMTDEDPWVRDGDTWLGSRAGSDASASMVPPSSSGASLSEHLAEMNARLMETRVDITQLLLGDSVSREAASHLADEPGFGDTGWGMAL